MSRIARIAALALALVGASYALGACQSIAGIEERTYVPGDSGAAGTSADAGDSPECVEYCDTAKAVCQTAMDGTIVPGGVLYLSDEACLATCRRLLEADPNSVACRMRQLNFVDTGEDVQRYCANAGPGGNGVCGSNCENYCRLFKDACLEEFEKYAPNSKEDDGIAVCVSKCEGLTDTGFFDTTKTATGNYLGDTVQCRLVHTCSSMLDPATHCSHAEFKAADKCLDDPKAEPDCEKFCHFEMTECADHPMYEDETQCKAVCAALDPGEIGDTTQNTVGCRMYHTYNSMIDPAHCLHTGPGGDGHCGDRDGGNCESYCGLLEKACKSDFDDTFGDAATCQTECLKLDGAEYEAGYTINATGNNLQCRLLNVSRALSNPNKYCASARGAGSCK